MKMKLLIALMLFVVVGFVWGLIESNVIRVQKYQLEQPDLKGLKIAFLSDFHYKNKYDSQKIKRAIRKVNKEKPDLIVLGGDYTEDQTSQLETVFGLIKELQAPLGVYYVTGNHDYLPGMVLHINELTTQYGIHSLNNMSYWITYNETRFKLGGIPDISHDHPKLDQTLDGVTKDDYVILILHQPDYVMELSTSERERIDLVISGHTHGGQITFFGYAPYIPSKYGQRFRTGLVQFEEGLRLIVSNGVGETQIPLRYFAPAEVVIVEYI